MRKTILTACAALLLGGASMQAQGWTSQAPTDGDFYLYNVGTGSFLSCGEDYGTHAVVGNGALKLTLANNGSGAYTLYTTSTFSYGNPNAAQLQSSAYVDQNVKATTWTFTPVDGMENVYTLLNAAGTYLTAPSDGSIKIVMSETAPTDNYGYWKLINYANLFPESASAENPSDVSCLIGDANFESTSSAMTGFWTKEASNFTFCGGSSPNKCAESYHSTFTLGQTLTVPNGYYKLSAQGFYRQDGSDNTNLPYFYANDTKITFPVRTGSEGSMDAASTSFTNGLYTVTSDVVTVTTKSITIGAKLESNVGLWCIFDNFKLQYLGPIDLTEYKTSLAEAVAKAEATEGTIPAAAYNAINAVVTEKNMAYDNEDDYSAAIAAINSAVSTNASDAIVKAYADYKAIRTAVLAIDNTIDVSAADAIAEAKTTDTDYTSATDALKTATKNYISSNPAITNKDLTSVLLVNPSFETGNFTGWTNSGMAVQNNNSFVKDGSWYAEAWQPNGTKSVSQTLSAMPQGVYRLIVNVKARGVTSAKIYAAGKEQAIKIADEQNDYIIDFACDDNTDITLGFEGVGTGAGSSWLSLDNFRLTLVSATLPEVTAIEGKMNAEVATAQTNAINTYNNEKTVANYNACADALAAAQASVDAYASASNAIAKANALKEAHNFASAEATTTFANAIAAIQEGYDNGTLADNDANNAATTLGVALTGWRAGNNNAAVVYLRDGFNLGDFAADPALHVNTWSTEGNTDGSDFTAPFYESWTGDSNSLPVETLTGSLTNLSNGLYSISAWVRVRAKNNVSATEATGITMNVNDGTAVDVTEGNQIGTTQFQINEYTAEGLVKDGNLKLNIVVADDANISWLSFKNVKYTKVRDLTPEEEIVLATAEDYTALAAAITAAEANVLGFDKGEFAPYNNAEAIAVLVAAQAINPETNNEQSAVQAATTALTNATWKENEEELNAVYNGDFSLTENNGAPAGWRSSNNTLGGAYHARVMIEDRLAVFNDSKSAFYMRFDGTNSDKGTLYHYDSSDYAYLMPLKNGVVYTCSFDFGGWGQQQNTRFYITDASGAAVGSVSKTPSAQVSTAGNTPDHMEIVFTPTVDGNCQIHVQNPGASANNAIVASNFVIKKTVTTVGYTFGAQYGTIVLPYDYTPDGFKAYTAELPAEGQTLVLTEVNQMLANKPYILEATQGDVFTFSGNPVAVAPVAETNGCLTGVYTITPAPQDSYVLQNQSGKVAFYQVDTEVAQPNVPANRAYLTVPASSGVKAFFFGEDSADAIQSVFDGLQSGDIYDLAGRKVSRIQKGGVYIVNGKKVAVK